MAAADKTENSGELLLEIGVEELPAAAAVSALEQVGDIAETSLKAERIDVTGDQIKVWVTPRRIAVKVSGLPAAQPAEEKADRGPAAAAAFDDDGKPTKAAEGFARAKGVSVDDLEIRDFKGQEFVFAVQRQDGRPLRELLPVICKKILHSISFPKTMRWNESDFRFSRPVRWLVTKYGDETITYETAGLVSGDISRGHRFLAPAKVKIASSATFKEQMAEAMVMVDQEQRLRIIIEGLESAADQRGATYSDPAGRLEEVIYLVEHPSVQTGSFAEEHLRLPAKVLVTAMQSHQRYFPLVNSHGDLVNGFLYVMNGDPGHAAGITAGNERILKGRIEDAEFSFDRDLDHGIEAMAQGLDKVMFHRSLGSLADKTTRLVSLVEVFADTIKLDAQARKTTTTAAGLAKADLVSVMVQEFPELQGYIGSVYAEMEGYPADVCAAIAEQYLPAAAAGELPDTLPGAVLSVCDKIDNIVAAFSVDELPTGSRDPYGLRRAAVGIAGIARKFELDFDLTGILTSGHNMLIEQQAQVDRGAGLAAAAIDFIFDRIQHRQVEQGMPVEVFEAARASGISSALRLTALAESLDAFRSRAGFDDLHTAYFRCSKIAAKAESQAAGAVIDRSLFQEPAEEEFFAALEELEPRLQDIMTAGDYTAALEAAAAIRPAVDRFFDDVMVMADDEAVRTNRLGMVQRAAAMLLKLGDPIQVAAAPPG